MKKILEVAFFRLFFSQGSDCVAVFEVIDKRFFATNRKMNKLELGRDRFFDFDPCLEIFLDIQILYSRYSKTQNLKIMIVFS